MKKDGDIRFKKLEREVEVVAPAGSMIIVRVDGCAFHTYTKRFARPYDEKFMRGMNNAAVEIAKTLGGVAFAYVQSDEISVLILPNHLGELPFSGRLQKLASVASSAATVGLISELGVEGSPHFDARAIYTDSWDDVQDYIDWRRLDSRKNAVSNAVSVLYAPLELQCVSLSNRYEMLVGTPYERLPEGFFNGRLVYPKSTALKLDYEGAITVPATRNEADRVLRRLRAENESC